MTETDPITSLRCKAKARTGAQCAQKAVPGAAVCRYHGGAAPQVKRRAALRLIELIDPAIATLAREMVSADKSSDRLRAANSILDRAGVARVTEVNSSDAKTQLLDRLMLLRSEAAQTLDDTNK